MTKRNSQKNLDFKKNRMREVRQQLPFWVNGHATMIRRIDAGWL